MKDTHDCINVFYMYTLYITILVFSLLSVFLSLVVGPVEANPEYQLIVESNNLLVEIENEICKTISLRLQYCTCILYSVVYMYVSARLQYCTCILYSVVYMYVSARLQYCTCILYCVVYMCYSNTVLYMHIVFCCVHVQCKC